MKYIFVILHHISEQQSNDRNSRKHYSASCNPKLRIFIMNFTNERNCLQCVAMK